MLGRLRHIFRLGIHGRVHTTHIGSVAITEFHTVTVFFFIVWSPTLVLGDIDRFGTLFDEGTILDSQGAVAFKQLSAYDIPSSICIKKTWRSRNVPVGRVPIFLYSSLSFDDRPLILSSSWRVFLIFISWSNFFFHCMNVSTVTGVPLVRASSA